MRSPERSRGLCLRPLGLRPIQSERHLRVLFISAHLVPCPGRTRTFRSLRGPQADASARRTGVEFHDRRVNVHDSLLFRDTPAHISLELSKSFGALHLCFYHCTFASLLCVSSQDEASTTRTAYHERQREMRFSFLGKVTKRI